MYRYLTAAIFILALTGCNNLRQRRILKHRPMVHQIAPSIMEIYWDTPVGKHFCVVDHNIDTESTRQFDYTEEGCKLTEFRVPLVRQVGYHRVYLHYYQSSMYFYLYAYEVVNDFTDDPAIAVTRP